jgi:hypothetical protein
LCRLFHTKLRQAAALNTRGLADSVAEHCSRHHIDSVLYIDSERGISNVCGVKLYPLHRLRARHRPRPRRLLRPLHRLWARHRLRPLHRLHSHHTYEGSKITKSLYYESKTSASHISNLIGSHSPPVRYLTSACSKAFRWPHETAKRFGGCIYTGFAGN